MALDVLSGRVDTLLAELGSIRYWWCPGETEAPESLPDHLALTAGFAVPMVVELLERGRRASDVCGAALALEELVIVTRVASLLHDVGKAVRGGAQAQPHARASAEQATALLKETGAPKDLRTLIEGAILRHHVGDGPRTDLEKVVCLANLYASPGRERNGYEGAPAKGLRETEAVTQIEEELFGRDKGVVLLAGDLDAIRDFVFETGKLPEICGGSSMLHDVEKEIRRVFGERLTPESVIYCGGGGFLAVCAPKLTELMAREIETSCLRLTTLATITVVKSSPVGYRELAVGPLLDPVLLRRLAERGGVAWWLARSWLGGRSGEERPGTGFGHLVAKVSSDMRQAKLAKSRVPFIPSLPIQRRCESCGKRAAAHWDRVTEEFVCDTCNRKREKGRNEKEAGFWLEGYGERLQAKGLVVEGGLPANMAELAGGEEKYVALLHVDGNDIGDLLQQASGPAAYRRISHALHEGVRGALVDALVEVTDAEVCRFPKLPFRVVNVGGDDANVLVRASLAWQLALNFLCAFEARMEAAGDLLSRPGRVAAGVDRITASAGVAIADAKYPVSYLEMIAQDLVRMAKRKAREIARLRARRESAAVFLWLKTPVAATAAKALLEQLYLRDRGGAKWGLTARPFSLRQACELKLVAEELARLPRTQRHRLAGALEEGRLASLNFALFQATRMGSRQANEEFRSLLRRAGEVLADSYTWHPEDWFWVFDECGRPCTALLDALELAELMEGVR